MLSPSLKEMEVFPYSAAEQIREAATRASKMSVQGIQPKLSAVLAPSKRCFELVETGGRYILKPQHPGYLSLPENEDLTMRLARLAGIDVPIHGMLWCSDGSLTYFVRRFDRRGRNERLALEDFAQLAGRSRETKYDSSMESLVRVINAHCTFPAVERRKLFLLSIFCYLTGNEDMHLKNLSLLTHEGTIGLSPAYDLLNSTLVLPDGSEEVALPLRGKRRRLTRNDWVEYWGSERLELPPRVLEGVLAGLRSVLPGMFALVGESFLGPTLREGYLRIVRARASALGLM